MRKLILLALVAVLALPAYAARRVSVEQLEQTLTATIAVRIWRTPTWCAMISALELSERLTDATLNRFAARFALSPRMSLALQLLADQSAFLDPPAGELPATAPPDTAAQQHMMDAARGYAVQTLPHLPNFFATRTTHRFDNSPQVLEKGGWAVRAGLHPLGSVSRQITYRDGQEIQDTTQPSGAAQPQQEIGLHSWGEFGPALTVVMTDTAKGTVTFNHWEQTPAGLAAVYHYSVPRAASHYGVTFCCIAEEQPGEVNSTGGGRGRSDGQMINPLQPVVSHAFRETPGYHGSLVHRSRHRSHPAHHAGS